MTSRYQLQNDRICAVRAAPGLNICGQVPASSVDTLLSEGITHVISILQDRELLRRKQPQEQWKSFAIKQIAIDDEDTADILIHLDDVFNYIENALNQPKTDSNNQADTKAANKVLIHCCQGISRSGAFVVAYLMKKHSLSYSAALQLARESRDIITPNSGFEQQLRIYEHCKYDIYVPKPPSSPAPVSTPGPDKVDRQLRATAATVDGSAMATGPTRKTKMAYEVWKRERDIRAAKGEHMGQFSEMAGIAAFSGRLRLKAREREREKNAIDSLGGDSDGASPEIIELEGGPSEEEKSEKRQQQWRRVAEMEKAWNDKLIRGEVHRAKEAGDLSALMSEVFDSIRKES